MDFREYLKRIDFTEELIPSLKVLASLQKQHLLNIPFENLDIHYDRPIVLNKEKIYNKVVLEGRGGFCYELNGLFYELLLWIGFKCHRVSARVFDGNDFGAEFDHLAIAVQLNGLSYLTDVGFGDFTVTPLLLYPKVIQHDENGDFRIKRYGSEFIVYKYIGTEMKPIYKFENIPRSIDEFSVMCHYHQTNPESHFTQQKLISIATEQGRITLTDDKLKTTKDSSSTESHIKDTEEFKDALWKYFKIKIT